ncbi:hypothetical protein HPB50_007650 [Hyalomma asiaticum]|uniref:Uncharacterized protein n=1 Tax=Hyalomma asiaticum TaxID=266040 RepID=A0ACB7RK63_HYAAI|nr:hypothetical protein HPB50_007650 [Hyalomma asiaticum]
MGARKDRTMSSASLSQGHVVSRNSPKDNGDDDDPERTGVARRCSRDWATRSLYASRHPRARGVTVSGRRSVTSSMSWTFERCYSTRSDASCHPHGCDLRADTTLVPR